MSDSCPDRETIDRFSLGELDGKELQEIRAHFARCRSCEELSRSLRHERRRTRESGVGPGDRLGNYIIQQEIGRGAFGVVYKATQVEPVERPRVAIKIIKAGMDSDEVVRRFEAERRALAAMDHPGIAKVFDAGTNEQGRPYFVMEYIPGVSIVEHCNKNELNLDRILALFLQVCAAVQHAHTKGIVHRDLKPSNILVTYGDEEQVKVIDFGVAKALNRPVSEATLFTKFGQLMGTPAYMPPEQAEMSRQDIDTRADVYSLGVLLYELLTNTLPLDPVKMRERGLDGMLRMIREEQPMLPSRAIESTSTSRRSSGSSGRGRTSSLGLIRGDLDKITMKCLEKDRAHRYTTVSELALDIRRHMNHLPILAQQPSLSYKAYKFWQRNKVALIIAAALTGLASIVAWQTWSRVALQQQVDLARAHELGEFARMLRGMLGPENAAQHLAQAIALAPADSSLQLEKARHEMLDDQLDAAWMRATSVYESELSRSGDVTPVAASAAALLTALAERLGRDSEPFAKSANEHELDYERSLSASTFAEKDKLLTRSLEQHHWTFWPLWERGVARFRAERYTEALEDAELLISVVADERPVIAALAWNLHGAVLLQQQDLDRAADSLERALALASLSSHGDALPLVDFNRGLLFSRQFDFQGAIDSYESARDSGLQHPDLMVELADAHLRMSAFQRCIDILDECSGCDRLVDASILRGLALKEVFEYEQAVVALTSALGEPLEPDVRANVLAGRGASHLGLDQLAKAQPDLEDSLHLVNDPFVRPILGRIRMLNGEKANALAEFQRALDDAPGNPTALVMELGLGYWALGDLDNAWMWLSSFTSTGERETHWSRIWLWDIATRIGDDAAARKQLLFAASDSAPDVIREIADVLSGARSMDETVSDSWPPADKLYLHFALGMLAEHQGDAERATTHYEAALGQGLGHYWEHTLARMRLSRLRASA